jgi:transposase-like protein
MKKKVLDFGKLINSDRSVLSVAGQAKRFCCENRLTVLKSETIDETGVKIKGRRYYLYRAVDSKGRTIDFLLSDSRDARAARRFLRRMLKNTPGQSPRVINVDKNPAYPPAVQRRRLSPATEGKN